MDTVAGSYLPENKLAWKHLVAAFWSIAWPGLVIPFLVFDFLSNYVIQHRVFTLSLIAVIAFLLGQLVLLPRLYQKKYRSFRLEIERNDGKPTRGLSISEIAQVSIRILWPQTLFLIAVFLFSDWSSQFMDQEQAHGINTLLVWARFLVVGPYSIAYALRAQYSGFRLRTYTVRL